MICEAVFTPNSIWERFFSIASYNDKNEIETNDPALAPFENQGNACRDLADNDPRKPVFDSLEKYIKTRKEYLRELIDMAEKSCPWQKGNVIALKEPFQRMRAAKVKKVCAAYNYETLQKKDDWLLLGNLLKKNGEPSCIWVYISREGVSSEQR